MPDFSISCTNCHETVKERRSQHGNPVKCPNCGSMNIDVFNHRAGGI